MSSQPSSAAGTISFRTIALSLVPLLFIAGCSAPAPRENEPVPEHVEESPPPAPVSVPARTAGEQAAVAAVRQVGVPYRYGGNSAAGFDCSGLVQFAYAKAGRKMPRTTGELWREMRPVPDHDLEVGDVLFFNIEGKVSHVGLYLGSRRFVHAPSGGREVTIASLDSDFYREAFIRGGRPR